MMGILWFTSWSGGRWFGAPVKMSAAESNYTFCKSGITHSSSFSSFKWGFIIANMTSSFWEGPLYLCISECSVDTLFSCISGAFRHSNFLPVHTGVSIVELFEFVSLGVSHLHLSLLSIQSNTICSSSSSLLNIWVKSQFNFILAFIHWMSSSSTSSSVTVHHLVLTGSTSVESIHDRNHVI